MDSEQAVLDDISALSARVEILRGDDRSSRGRALSVAITKLEEAGHRLRDVVEGRS